MSRADDERAVVIVATARTPIGKFGGALVASDAIAIGGAAIAAATERSGLAPNSFDETVVGHARQAICGSGGHGAAVVLERA